MNLATGPLVVIPEPIRSMGWSYDVERSILEPLGIRLVVPDTAERGGDGPARRRRRLHVEHARPPTTSTGSAATASGSCATASGWTTSTPPRRRRAASRSGTARPRTTRRSRDHAMLLILAAQRRLLPLRTGRGGRATGTSTSGRSWARSTGCGRGRSGSSASAGSAIWSPRSSTASGRRSSPTTRTSRAPATPRSSSSRSTSWRRAPTSSSSCAALTDTSRGIIGADFLAKTKPGVLIVNVSRGGIVVEDALRRRARSRAMSPTRRLDVRSPEPPDPANDRITGRDDVTLTQHIAASSVESIAGLHVEAAEQIVKLLREAGRLPAAVTPHVRQRRRSATGRSSRTASSSGSATATIAARPSSAPTGSSGPGRSSTATCGSATTSRPATTRSSGRRSGSATTARSSTTATIEGIVRLGDGRPDHGQHVRPVADLDRRPRVHRPGRDDPQRPDPRPARRRRRRHAARPSRTT